MSVTSARVNNGVPIQNKFTFRFGRNLITNHVAVVLRVSVCVCFYVLLNLTVYSTLNEIDNILVCYGLFSYEWNGWDTGRLM